jgi:carbohydrate diacid regulator
MGVTDLIPVFLQEHQPDLPILTTSREHIARQIAERLAELLCTSIWVLDVQQEILASTLAEERTHATNLNSIAAHTRALRVAFCSPNAAGTVIIGAPPNGEVISPRLARALISMVINQGQTADQAFQRGEWKKSFVCQLLQGAMDDDAQVLQIARQLGLDLATPRAVILIDAKEYIHNAAQHEDNGIDQQHEQQRAHLIISSIVGFFHLPNDTICTYIGSGEIAVLKASNTENLLPWVEPGVPLEDEHSSWANLAALKQAGEALITHLHNDISSTISVGIGRYHPGVVGIAQSYQDARAALTVGRRYNNAYRVHCLNHLGIAAFVDISDAQMKLELAAHLLSPLDHEPELLDTLRVFFAQNCCPSDTARQLVIHRNTLAYRLQKVALLTGLDPRRFEDATQIHLALLLRSSNQQSQHAEKDITRTMASTRRK